MYSEKYIDNLINDYNNPNSYRVHDAGEKLVEALSNNVYLSSYLVMNFPWDRFYSSREDGYTIAMKYEIVKHIQFGLSTSIKIMNKTYNKNYFPYMEEIDKMLPEYGRIVLDYNMLKAQLGLCEVACNALEHCKKDKPSSEELSQAFNIVANIVNNASRAVQDEGFNEYVERVNNIYGDIREYIGDDFEPSTMTTENVEGGVAKLNPDILIRIGANNQQSKVAHRDDNVDQM